MKYTTINRINLKLNTRLNLVADENSNVNEDEEFPGVSTSVNSTIVNPALINLIADEKENYLDLILKLIYILPLQNEHLILADIVEGLVISDLLTTYYHGFASLSPGADVSAMSVQQKNHSYYLIGLLTCGRNIYLPNLPQVPQNLPGVPSPSPVILEGETLLVDIPNIVKRVDVLHGKRESNSSRNDLGIDFGYEFNKYPDRAAGGDKRIVY